jgi:hypothetical protein
VDDFFKKASNKYFQSPKGLLMLHEINPGVLMKKLRPLHYTVCLIAMSLMMTRCNCGGAVSASGTTSGASSPTCLALDDCNDSSGATPDIGDTGATDSGTDASVSGDTPADDTSVVDDTTADDQTDGDDTDGGDDEVIADADQDGIADEDDNCPTIANPLQEQTFGNPTLGDACNPDRDADGLCDVADLCDGHGIDPNPGRANIWYWVDTTNGDPTLASPLTTRSTLYISGIVDQFGHIEVPGAADNDQVDVLTFCGPLRGPLLGICVGRYRNSL